MVEHGEVGSSECKNLGRNKELNDKLLTLKSSIAEKRCKELYDAQAALKLQNAIKRKCTLNAVQMLIMFPIQLHKRLIL